jgi:hypothetical protein
MLTNTLDAIKSVLTIDGTISSEDRTTILKVAKNPQTFLKCAPGAAWRPIRCAECCRILGVSKSKFHRLRLTDKRFRSLSVQKDSPVSFKYRSDEIEAIRDAGWSVEGL